MEMTKMTTTDAMIAAVRTHALDNYGKGGWDILVECWDDAEILKVIDGAKTAKAAIAACKRDLRIIDEYRSEVRASADW